ncbi:MAG: hypothetical protein K0R46_1444 [Herbinix sp.]|jgi:hypothetical protein|nr:hypothetical protein [Herbinix sp.]
MVQVLRESTTEYDYFVGQLLSRVTQRMGDGYTARIYKVTKNNSLELDSLVLLKEGKNFAPNIYLHPYYKAYQQGVGMNELVNRLCNIYLSCTTPVVDEKFKYSFEEMKSRIVYRLVSYERNQKLLQNIPHIRYLDLAITYHCLVREDDEGIGTIRITKEHMKQWKVQLKELHELATDNTNRLFPVSIRSMEEVIRSMLTEELHGQEEDISEDLYRFIDGAANSKNKMYILTNLKGINGASCLLYSNVLNEFSERFQSDFYLFPSSIHELILVPTIDQKSSKEYTDMVREINQTQVAPEEVLSDKIYYYSREKGLMVVD